MVKDRLLRLLFVPLLGVSIPFISGVVTYPFDSTLTLVVVNLYFILMSWSIWISSSWLHAKVRKLFTIHRNAFVKIVTVCSINALFGGAITAIYVLVWYKISGEIFSWQSLLLCTIFSLLAVIVFTLIYEILYLNKERELDTKIVGQMDWERSRTQMSILKKEIEPHFIFNCLNTLSHLILVDPKIAHQFNNKLATVYKYFLINKDREIISLQSELEFVDDYFFLLRLRHDNKLHLKTSFEQESEGTLMILPYSLQVLVENAIKHNEFSDEDPLKIQLNLNGEYLQVCNNKKRKPYVESSTGIGLKNLSARYRLFCNKDIQIETTDNEFIVKLPLIKQDS